MINVLSGWISPAAISGRLEPGPKRLTPAQNTAQKGQRKKGENEEMREVRREQLRQEEYEGSQPNNLWRLPPREWGKGWEMSFEN